MQGRDDECLRSIAHTTRFMSDGDMIGQIPIQRLLRKKENFFMAEEENKAIVRRTWEELFNLGGLPICSTQK